MFQRVRSRYHRQTIPWANFSSAEEAWSRLSEAKVKSFNDSVRGLFVDSGKLDAVLDAKIESLESREALGALVKVKAFASDRIVFTAFEETGPRFGKRSRLAKRDAGGAGVLRLDKCGESRRHVLVNGRRRFLPHETSFTKNAQQFVRDGAYLIESSSHTDSIFCTLTFPSGTQQSKDIYSMCSGYIIDRLNRWLRYKVNGGLWAYVWELTGAGVPHLHIVLAVHDANQLARISESIQREWRDILLDLCEKTACDLFERTGGGSWIGDRRIPFVACRRIRAGIANYVSKYVSKQRSKAGKVHDWCPGRWSGVSKPLRELVLRKRLVVSVRFPTLENAKTVLTSVVDKFKAGFTSTLELFGAAKYNVTMFSCGTGAGEARDMGKKLVAELALLANQLIEGYTVARFNLNTC